MMRHEAFAAFILTNRRPDSVITYASLRNAGYTGPIYLIVDNEDETEPLYRENYGDQVIVFEKQDADLCDNFNDRRSVVFARNASFAIAADLGLTHFIQLDDDYRSFCYRADSELEYVGGHPIFDLDAIFDLMLDYFESIPALSIAMGQSGDYMGGEQNTFMDSPRRRKAMNTFICSTRRPFIFTGRVNEDVSAYVVLGSQGGLFLTIPLVAIFQVETQHNPGGLTEVYTDYGTYVKSFYTLMQAPSCTHLMTMGEVYRRIHHHITWANAVPAIIPETYKRHSDGAPK